MLPTISFDKIITENMNYYCFYDCIIGRLVLVSDGKYLLGIYHTDFLKFNLKNFTLNNNLQIFIKTKELLSKYFLGEKINFNILPLKFNCTQFQLRVFKILQSIKYSNLISYGQIAKLLQKQNNKKISPRAVGGALKNNPFLIAIPCHRVIGSNNNLGGYYIGIENKLKLLKLEGIDTNIFYK